MSGWAQHVVVRGVLPVDVFALHIYTRAELFGSVNATLREPPPGSSPEQVAKREDEGRP